MQKFQRKYYFSDPKLMPGPQVFDPVLVGAFHCVFDPVSKLFLLLRLSTRVGDDGLFDVLDCFVITICIYS